MYKTLKRQSLKKVLPRCVAALVLAAVLLAVTGFGVFTLLAGARDLDQIPVDQLEGSLVRFDVSRVISAFASAGGSTPSEQYYILDLGDGRYLSVTAGRGALALLDRAADQSEAYYMNGSGILNPLGVYSGQVTAMDEELYDYLTSWLDQVGVLELAGGSAEASALPLTVNFQKLGGMSFTLIRVLSLIALALILYAAAELILVLSGVYCAAVKKAVTAGGDDGAELEADFAAAPVFGHIRVGRRYVWYCKGARARAIPTTQIIWAFNQLDSRLMGRYPHILSVYLTDRSSVELGTHSPEERDQICRVIAGYGSPFLAGYSQQRAQLFAHDFPQFKALAAKAAKSAGANN